MVSTVKGSNMPHNKLVLIIVRLHDLDLAQVTILSLFCTVSISFSFSASLSFQLCPVIASILRAFSSGVIITMTRNYGSMFANET